MAKKLQATKRTTANAKKSLDVPADLLTALKQTASAQQAFLALSPSHQREYLKWIDEAKRDETRVKRIASTVEKLASSSK
jgi:uncharacterized protein YdeI (YjbR/CyaY-like superfamily)